MTLRKSGAPTLSLLGSPPQDPRGVGAGPVSSPPASLSSANDLPSAAPRRGARIIDYQPAQRPRVLALFRRHFGQRYAERLAAQWDWQFVDNPFARERPPLLSLLETDEGAIVGALLGHPVPLRFRGLRAVALCGGGLVIDPSYRLHCLYLLRRHLAEPPGVTGGLVIQVRELYERCGAVFVPATRRRYVLNVRDQGARCLRARERIGAGIKLASQHIPLRLERLRLGARVAGWTIPRISVRLVGFASGQWRKPAAYDADGGPTRDCDIRSIERFDAGYDELWKRVGTSFECTIERDSTYMNWRYVEAPHHHPIRLGLYERGRLAAVAIATHWTEKDFLGDPCAVHADIVELLAEDLESSSVMQLVQELLRALDRRHRVDTVGAFACSPQYSSLFTRLGFEAKEDPRFAMAVNWSGDVSEQSLNHRLSWYASSSDTDCLYACSL